MSRLLFALVLAFAFVFAPTSARAEGATPVLSEERIVLRTVAGDLVLVLYPEVAPRTVEQILKLVRGGVYDTTAFVRVDPGFVAQLSAHHDRTVPINDEQRALVHKIPAEFSTIKHVRGVLSMAREDADVNSGETSFSILLGPAPHLDGKYTVFGRLESGDAVLEEMVRVPRGEMMRPLVRLDVLRAEVISASALPSTSIAPAHAVAVPAELVSASESVGSGTGAASGSEAGRRDVGTELAWVLAFMCLIGLASFFLQGKVPTSVHGSLNLLVVLVGAFALIVVLMPKGQRSPWLAATLFFGLVGLFKLLGRFERPSEK